MSFRRANVFQVFMVALLIYIVMFIWCNMNLHCFHQKCSQSPKEMCIERKVEPIPTTNTNEKEYKLWYDPKSPDDRILNQIKHIPDAYKRALHDGTPPRKKVILRWEGFKPVLYGAFLHPEGRTFENCSVNLCELTNNRSRLPEVDAALFEYGHPKRSADIIPRKQIWIMYKMESPMFSRGVKAGDQFNWTASYRLDSTFVIPHYKFIRKTPPTKSLKPMKNYAKGKTKKIVWFVSHCNTSNKRMEYVRELSRYIPVDIYGKCGNMSCTMWSKDCFNIIRRHYKFYLAFENANCRHYVTEKLTRNALVTDTVPIVMGAPQQDYETIAPPNSYIHIDDFESPRHLADYLHVLDKNERMYNSYFKWKRMGYFMGAQATKFWCRLCSLLYEQDSRPPSWYEDTNKWWRGKGVCIGSDRWRDHLP